MTRWLSLIPLVVLAALAVLFIGWSLKRDPEFKPEALVGQTVPETVLPILQDGVPGPQNVDLRTAGVGKPMIVNVFASWCAPCRVEHPQLLKLQAQGIAVVGVAYKDEPEATQAFLDELGDPFELVLVDQDGRAGLDLGISGVPESFAVNAMGEVVAKSSGPLLTDADLRRMTDALIAPSRPLPTARTPAERDAAAR
ncbi:thiol:disulfide interchange protein [Brevundimonas sp. LM2]|uniref:DsbE family thiol:disulfide interchange protein n=1 Tax=Brevundimonas sp. LM2 TaxID=1938605 RepID=UPI000983F800|nr:DsbE family thiol:disulfide interchange protein [Brevundimonas sp. LM2]AQR60334.1 thiol:disulfide interchange protein [Brevundimonas sp. LM2]